MLYQGRRKRGGGAAGAAGAAAPRNICKGGSAPLKSKAGAWSSGRVVHDKLGAAPSHHNKQQFTTYDRDNDYYTRTSVHRDIPLDIPADFGRRYPRRHNTVFRNYDVKSGRGPKISRVLTRAIAAEDYFSPPLQNHLPTPLYISMRIQS